MAAYSARIYAKSLVINGYYWRIGIHKLEGKPLMLVINHGTVETLNGEIVSFEATIGKSPYLVVDLGKRNSRKARNTALANIHRDMLLNGQIPANTPLFKMD